MRATHALLETHMMATHEVDAPNVKHECFDMANLVASAPHSNHMASGSVSIQRQPSNEAGGFTDDSIADSHYPFAKDLSRAEGITIVQSGARGEEF